MFADCAWAFDSPFLGSSKVRRSTVAFARVRHVKRVFRSGLGVLLAYVLFAYVLVPFIWLSYAYRHPAFGRTPGITMTGDDHPGDPINVARIGLKADLSESCLRPGGRVQTH